jgi:molybdenum cofactor biosynthesis protein B
MINSTSSPETTVNIAVLTVSDTRNDSTDTSGDLLADRIRAAGHQLAEKLIVVDDVYEIRAVVSRWIADAGVNVIITTGGTGLTGRDSTPEAVQPLLDKEIDGFADLFRWVSWDEVGTAVVQTRALAGLANATFIFCIPGSANACQTAWDKILKFQLDAGHKPCNFVDLIPRLTKR